MGQPGCLPGLVGGKESEPGACGWNWLGVCDHTQKQQTHFKASSERFKACLFLDEDLFHFIARRALETNLNRSTGILVFMCACAWEIIDTCGGIWQVGYGGSLHWIHVYTGTLAGREWVGIG